MVSGWWMGVGGLVNFKALCGYNVSRTQGESVR